MLYRKVIQLNGYSEKSTGEVSTLLMYVADSEGLTQLIPRLTIVCDLEPVPPTTSPHNLCLSDLSS